MPIDPPESSLPAGGLGGAAAAIDDGRWLDAVTQATVDVTDGDYQEAVSLLSVFANGGRQQALAFGEATEPESQYRGYLLHTLPPEIRDFADKARRELGQKSATSGLGLKIAVIAMAVAYYGVLLTFQYRDQPEAFPWIMGFYVLIVVLGWLRFRFAKPDTYSSIRER